MMKKIHILTLISLALFFITSCIKEAINLPTKFDTINSKTGIPLVDADVSLASTINKFTSVEVNSEGFYEMVIKPNKFDFITAENLIKLPNPLVNTPSLGSSPESPVTGSQSTITFSTSVGVDFNTTGVLTAPGTDLKKVFFKAGNIKINLTHTFGGRTLNPVRIIFSNIKSIVSNFELVLTVPSAIASGASTEFNGNLNGYYIDISAGSSIPVEVSATITSGTATTGGISLSNFSIDNLGWKRLEGKFGNMQIPLVENGIQQIYKFGVSPFSSNTDNNSSVVGPTLDFLFVNPSLKITFFSEFGTSSSVLLDPLKGLSEDGTRVTSSVAGVVLPIGRPNDPYSGSFVITPNEQINTITGSTLNPLLKPGPSSLNYGLVLSVSGSSNATDFIHDNSKISAKSELRLPFHGRGKFFNLQTDVAYPGASDGTGKFNVTDSISASVESALFILKATNSIPIAFEISIQFLDENKVFIDEISSGVNQPAVKVDGADIDASTLRANDSKISSTTSEINRVRFDLINTKCKFVRLKARPQTTGYDQSSTNFVKIFPTDKLNIQMSVIAKTKIEQK